MCFEFMSTTRMLKRYLDNNATMRYAEKYTGNNIWILGYLFRNSDHDVFQKDIEEAFSVRRSTVSKAIKLMVEKGLIKREPVGYDARLKRLIPTEKAAEIHEIVNEQMQELGDKFVSNLSEEEMEQLIVILAKIRESLEKEEQTGQKQ